MDSVDMKIGVTVHFHFSFFSAGSPQAALAIAEVFRVAGHQVDFINIGKEGKAWWDDCQAMKEVWTAKQAQEIQKGEYDLLLEIGTNFVSPSIRALCKRVVWVIRKPILLHDVEASLYPFENPDRDLEGLSEIWLTKETNSEDDKQYLEVLTRKPVRFVPFIWTPTGAENHRKEVGAPVWPQVVELPEAAGLPWSIHITETNNTAASSCTIPLFIMREVKKGGLLTLKPKVMIHNAENVAKSEFFRANVLAHAFSDIQDMSGEFLGRQRAIDWVYDPKSIVIAHSRFQQVRPYLVDLLWVGIPLVHNSPVLRRLGGIAEAGYYPDNEISKGRAAFEAVCGEKLGVEELMKMREAIMVQMSPLSGEIQKKYEEVLTEPLPVSPGGGSAGSKTKSKPLRVGFAGFWGGFHADYNPFTLMLEAATGSPVEGIELEKVEEGKEDVDVCIFTIFTHRWETVKKSIPKIHYTGENTDPIEREDVKLNIGFKHKDGNPGNYLRLPLWMLEINWFKADVDRLENPRPIPIDRCTEVYPEEISRHLKKFCAFVVSNPGQPMRNAAFQWLSNYKQVDSAGRLFNNVGGDIFSEIGGGGGGELKKLEFLKDYKFCIAYENESAPGYLTEKLLHAKAAGCIPIYWGDSKAERDFNFEGVIDARGVTTSAELIKLVKEVDEDDGLWLRKFSYPLLDSVKVDWVRRTLAECARRICEVAGMSTEGMPEMIGAAGDDLPVLQAVRPVAATGSSDSGGSDSGGTSSNEIVYDAPPPSATAVALNETVYVSGANTKFLAAVQLWLQSITANKNEVSELQAIVYLMNDVTEDSQKALESGFPFAQFRRFPVDQVPAEFPEFWEPGHFGWKLYILKELVSEEKLKGKPILYMDSGIMMCRRPGPWLQHCKENGISLLEDPRHDNGHMCHELFQTKMKMNEVEQNSKQLWAGSIAFISGHPLPTHLFNEAWKLGQDKELLVGPKWSKTGTGGKVYGHRHDQSILSLLSHRFKVPRFALDDIYCDISLRHTYLSGAYFYVHRGFFRIHEPVLEGIDDCWVINLDRREDRLERFYKAHPDLAMRVLRMPAFEGTKLKLTPKLARLFAPHDFAWKKPVMGCALSHLAMWCKLAGDKEDIQSYLIMEDDAVLKGEWKKAWKTAVKEKHLPADWDVIYLGGVLPPNREGFEAAAVEKVNDSIARVRMNTVFGQEKPNRYFHFCAYAYVLSKRGAIKILEYMKVRGGYWTSADHMICNIHDLLNIYFLHPLVAGCYQDDDPVYQKSEFNDFSRVDKFDSDLWNNTERFSDAEVGAVLKGDDPLDILGALEDARRGIEQSNVAPVAPPAAPAPAPEEKPKTLVEVPARVPNLGKRRLVSIGGPLDISKMHEFAWLRRMLWENAKIPLEVEELPANGPAPTDSPIVIFQQPHILKATAALKRWSNAGASFYILHLSDEGGTDCIDAYTFKGCKGVLRNYVRGDLTETERIRVIPLGYHWAISEPQANSLVHTPRPPFRELTWSFVGTDWSGRSEKLSPLTQIPGDHKLKFMKDWNSAEQVGREEMLGILLNSWCVPCPAGVNAETFRAYEALEAGAVPVFVKEEGMEKYLAYLGRWIQLLTADNWQHAAQLIYSLRMQPELYEKYRIQVLSQWERLKGDVRRAVLEVFEVSA
jgi:GR25 family glycosyltransferase involved in LPS biosynthesis